MAADESAISAVAAVCDEPHDEPLSQQYSERGETERDSADRDRERDRERDSADRDRERVDKKYNWHTYWLGAVEQQDGIEEQHRHANPLLQVPSVLSHT